MLDSAHSNSDKLTVANGLGVISTLGQLNLNEIIQRKFNFSIKKQCDMTYLFRIEDNCRTHKKLCD